MEICKLKAKVLTMSNDKHVDYAYTSRELSPYFVKLSYEDGITLFHELFKEFTINKQDNQYVTHKILQGLRKCIGSYSVYKLIDKGEVVYIGSTIDLASRIKSHNSDKYFDNVEVCGVENEVGMLSLENSLIYKHLPKYNKMIHTRYIDKNTMKDLIQRSKFSNTKSMTGYMYKLPAEFAAEEFNCVENLGHYYRFDEEVVPYWVDDIVKSEKAEYERLKKKFEEE